jgi:hypothetical protein
VIPKESVPSLRAMAAVMAQQAPISADLLTMLTDDLENDGPATRMLADHPDAAAPLYYLRALAGVRLLILTGCAPELEAHLAGMVSHRGDPAYAEHTRDLFRRTLFSHPDEIRSAMDRPIQQHQPGRAGYLLRGLGMLAAPKVRLLEIGACAGLNLILDHYRWCGPDWEWGAPSSPVRLATSGPYPGDIEIVHRAGCDIAPRDAADPDDAAILRSFLPVELEADRLELDNAIELAAFLRVRVDKADAVEWLRAELSRPAEADTYTVVWHSLFWLYLDPGDRSAVEGIMAAAARHMRLARICYEPRAWGAVPQLQVIAYS